MELNIAKESSVQTALSKAGLVADKATVDAILQLVQNGGSSGGTTVNAIKSIQRGTINAGEYWDKVEATINEVNLDKSIVLKTGVMSTNKASGTVTDVGSYECGIYLSSSTTVSIERYSAFSEEIKVAYCVIEFN